MAHNRDTLWSTGQDESVEVNQRALIDKVLARYSGKFTVFRELLQNSDDARSPAVEIRFETAAYLRRKDSEQGNIDVPSLPNLKSANVTQWTFRNNGITFRNEDWTRLREIAEGNPDEEKVGAFGVGFYSLFSVTEKPFVSSGGRAMQFYWKDNKDQLNVRRGNLPSQETTNPWTTFEMELREPAPIPPALDFMRFLASSITFMIYLNDVSVYFDEHRIGHIKKSPGMAKAIDLPDGSKCSSQSGIMNVKRVQSRPVRIEASVMHAVYTVGTEKCPLLGVSEPQEPKDDFFSFHASAFMSQSTSQPQNPVLPPQPPKDQTELHEMNVTLTVFTAEVDVKVDKKLLTELLRCTKKKPPARLKYHLIYTGKDEYDRSLADDKSQPVACGSIFRGLRADLNGTTHARVFIGHSTGQTTGTGGHMASFFIPTVERESIDFVDRNVAIWNKELLYIGGFLSRAVYELELSNIHVGWTAAAHGTPDVPPPPELQTRLQEQFVHTLKFFAFHSSTPSSEVGRLLEDSFYGCSTAPLRMLSSVGVREASKIRGYDPVFTGFLKDVPMLPQFVTLECGHTKMMQRNQRMISPVTFSDVLHDLRHHRLNKEELVSCLQWWIGLGEGSSAIDVAELLDVIVLSNIDGSMLPLSSVQYFINPQTLGHHVPRGSPLPTSLLPQDVAKKFTLAELRSFGWQEFTVVDWLQYISQPDVMSANPIHDFTKSISWAADLLTVLSHVWASSVDGVRCLAKEIFTNKTCVPTSRGLYAPEASYLPGTSTGFLYDAELPIVQFPGGLKITGEMQALLSFIGVRKHIDPQLILDGMPKTRNWNVAGFIGYLVQVRDSLAKEEVTRLRSSAVFAKEGVLNDTTCYCACELYAPIEIHRQLQLPVIQWDEKSIWRDDSNEAQLLFDLGLCRYPPLEKLVDLCSSQDVTLRTAAFRCLCENIPTRYSDYEPCNFGTVAFIPAENNDGNHLGKLGDVFSGIQWKLLGFSVVQEGFRQAPTRELGIQQHPPTSMIISRLKESPPPNKDTARRWFETLSEQISAFKPHELVVLKQLPIVPSNSSGVQRLLSPSQCYLGGGTRDDFYSRLFAFVDFGSTANRFLSACGSRDEPSVKDIAESLTEDPKLFHSRAGSDENFLTQLRNLAVNKQRISNMTLGKMKFGPILLGVKVKDPQGLDYRVRELRSPKEIVVADDINAYRLFRDAAFFAPQEELLEDFYVSLGCKRLSTIVQEECEVLDEILDTKTCSDMRALVLERLTLFLHEYTHAKPKVSVAWLSNAENFRVRICKKLSVSKTLVVGGNKTKRTQDMSAGAKRDEQGRIALWLSHSTERDMYEVSTSLFRLLFGTAKVCESLLFTTILSMDVAALRRRGFHVDQVLKGHQRDEPTGEIERKGPVMELEEPRSSTSAKPHHVTPASSSRLSLPENSKAVTRTPTPPTLLTRSTGNNIPSRARNRLHDLKRKAVSLVRPPRATGTVTSLQPVLNPRHVVPHSRIRANIDIAIKACNSDEGQPPCRSNDMEATEGFLKDGCCDASGRIDNMKLIGELGVSAHAGKRETVKVFATEDVPNLGTFMVSKREPLNRFVNVIVPIAKVYKLQMTSLHIFCDVGGGPIAFNRNGALYLNLRYFEAWHDRDVERGVQQQARTSWFFTLAHEIAHNLVKPHNSEHAFWFSAICEEHISSFVRILGPTAGP